MKLYDVIRKEQLEEKEHNQKIEDIVEELEKKSDNEQPRYSRPRKQFAWKKLFLVAGAIAFIALLYMLGITFVHATVRITERRIPFSLDHAKLELVHEKEADAGRLAFQTMVVTTEVSREIFGSEITTSITKAKGSVVVFNEYSKSAQTVKSGTTLTASTGKRYITQESVTVPGYTMNGKLKVPGTSKAITVVAADSGATYNSDGTSFTISGWTGTKAKQFYARSAGALSGGDTGARHTVTASEREQIIATLQAQLTERLKRETRAQIPADLVTFPDLQFISIDPNAIVLDGQNIKITATMKGTMVSYLISRSLLETAIATKAMSDHGYPNVSVPGLGDLSVVPLTTIPADPKVVPEAISVSVTGPGTIITKAPVENIKELLVGASRRTFAAALQGIPEIDKARFSLTPFWAPLFPRKENDITVVVE